MIEKSYLRAVTCATAWASCTRRRIWALAVAGILADGALLGGCITHDVQPIAVTGLVPSADDLTLGPGDTFDVRVFGEPDLSGPYRLSEDGTIDFPLVGQIRLEGMDPHKAAGDIQARLADKFLKNPQVSIFVHEQSSKKIIVGGQVAKPGSYQFVPNMTVLEAIAVAGGFTPIAAKHDVKLARTEKGARSSMVVDVPAVSDGRVANVPLRPGDVVTVPERIF